jgi:hypothetical protein
MTLKKWRLAACVLPIVLAACGGGSDEPLSCSVPDQKTWLGEYMNDWYFWYRLSPRPNPAGYATVAEYFDALLYTGTDVNFPADRWSNFESTASFQQFFGDGETLGYGVSVAGLEVSGSPQSPLYVRYVEPLSPAAAAGVARGDQVISLNGRTSADIIAANDFSALTATASGQTLRLVLRRAGQDRTVTLTSAVFALTPVQGASVVTTPGGRKMGYLLVKDMINQANTPMDTAFSQFKAQGVTEVVLDLRYNGGGLVSVGNRLASNVAGSRGNGRSYAKLLYNDKRASANNQSFAFTNPASAVGLARVFVLMGERTCSASEQVINGLRGVGVNVVAIGDTSCGKPVGFLPQDDGCGTTYSVVNFESVNDLNEGRYFDGFLPTCAVAEDFTQPTGSTGDPLMVAARTYADTGSCPVAGGLKQPQALKRSLHRAPEAGERQGMLGR